VLILYSTHVMLVAPRGEWTRHYSKAGAVG